MIGFKEIIIAVVLIAVLYLIFKKGKDEKDEKRVGQKFGDFVEDIGEGMGRGVQGVKKGLKPIEEVKQEVEEIIQSN